MKIVYIRPSKTKGYIRLGIDTGEGVKAFNISEIDYNKLDSPMIGDCLSAALFEEIRILDMKYNARIKALNILSYGDNSERSLRMKLMNKGIRADIAAEVTNEMKERGYIDHERQLERLIINEVRLHLTGPAKLIPKLMAKGYSRSDIDIAIDTLTESGELDFNAARKKLISDKCGGLDDEEIRKVLYKNGYSVC